MQPLVQPDAPTLQIVEVLGPLASSGRAGPSAASGLATMAMPIAAMACGR